jgi:predicted O-methyltransferase YrrM
MDLTRVQSVVGRIPHMSANHARQMTDFIAEHRPADILELGFRHGVSTCYMAEQLNLLDPTGERGHITTIDLDSARPEPNIETLLTKLGLRERVTVFYEPTSYIWRLMLMLREDPKPRFDLAFIDGAHNWAVDGFAFFLVDRLLRPGGWIIFDDVHWSYAASPTLSKKDWVKAMPEDERETKQISAVVELLVEPHPRYSRVKYRGEWAVTQKLTDQEDLAEARAEAKKYRAAYEKLRGRAAVRLLATMGKAARQGRRVVSRHP